MAKPQKLVYMRALKGKHLIYEQNPQTNVCYNLGHPLRKIDSKETHYNKVQVLYNHMYPSGGRVKY